MPVRFGIVSNGIFAGDPTFHVLRTGCASTSCSAKNVIGLMSSIGTAVTRAGTNPFPVYRNTMSSSPPSGMGLKNPVSVFVTAANVLVAISYRKMFDTPVKYELP